MHRLKQVIVNFHGRHSKFFKKASSFLLHHTRC